jgi:hypothetical protein
MSKQCGAAGVYGVSCLNAQPEGVAISLSQVDSLAQRDEYHRRHIATQHCSSRVGLFWRLRPSRRGCRGTGIGRRNPNAIRAPERKGVGSVGMGRRAGPAATPPSTAEGCVVRLLQRVTAARPFHVYLSEYHHRNNNKNKRPLVLDLPVGVPSISLPHSVSQQLTCLNA